jgi:antitoxin component of MazEF toxin-antitoxin module
MNVSKIYNRKIMRVGGSVVVPIPRKLRQEMGIDVGDHVDVMGGLNGAVIIKKQRKVWDGRITRKN